MLKLKQGKFICSVCYKKKSITELSSATHMSNKHGKGRGRGNIYWCFDCDIEWDDIKQIANNN